MGEKLNVGKEIGGSALNLLAGAARGFGWEAPAMQSLQTICKWFGMDENDRLWKFGTEAQIANAISNKIKNSKSLSRGMLDKLSMLISNLPIGLSASMQKAVNQEKAKLQTKYKKANDLINAAEQYENQAYTSGSATTNKLAGTRIVEDGKPGFEDADKAERLYREAYELGKDY